MALFIFILLLIVLILVHEFGHFIAAKAFGIRVDEFGIFFPPRLFAKKFGETVYSFNLLPVGGFVKIFGENGDTDAAAEFLPKRSSDLPQSSSDDFRARPFSPETHASASFSRRSRPVQATVIVAGIVFNILFAWLALSVGYMVGMQTSQDHQGFGRVSGVQTTIVAVVPGSPAEKVGLKAEDVIVKIQTGTAQLQGGDGSAVQAFIVAHQDESMVLSVSRNKTEQTFLAKPAFLSGLSGVTTDHKAVGIELDDIGLLKLNPALALAQGALLTEQMTAGTATGLAGFLYSLATGGAHWGSVSGPIGIASVGSSAVRSGFTATIFLMALISINLAVINLVPIPGLDGGRFLFIVIEAIIHRPISEKIATRFTLVGFALLAALMLVVSFHDILKLVHPA
ncbi:MAG: site-2 protease family protein [bacterium]